jgi:lipopolysaccharide export system permease protein
MPLYWRFIASQFLKVFVLSAVSFVVILLTTRLEEIAYFATLGSTWTSVLIFTWNQVPFILPIAIPISCLISAVLLVQRLSTSYELTALRASGLSIGKILTPLLILSAYISIGNFYISSEMATESHLYNSRLKNEMRSINPLLLLQNKHVVRMKGIHMDTLGASKTGESADDVIIAMPNKDDTGLNFMVAKQLLANPGIFAGDHVTIIATPSPKKNIPIIENMGSTALSTQDFSLLLKPGKPRFNNDYFRFGLLRAKAEVETDAKTTNRIYSEMIRRISMGTAAFTFTLMGAAFGMSIGRRPSNRGIFIAAMFAGLYLFCYFAARGMDSNYLAAGAFHVMPQVVILLFSIYTLRSLEKGCEAW